MALTDNILAYYKFTSDATDSVGSYTGTVNGATNTTGKIGNGYDFDGTNDNIQVTAGGDILSGNSISVSMWINPDTISSTYYKRIFSCLTTINTFEIAVKSNALYVYMVDNAGAGWTAGSAISTGSFQHIVVTFDGTNLKSYVNNASPTSHWSSLTSLSSITSFYIGYGTNTNDRFDGKIDEVGIWDRALSSTEVSQLYNSGDGLQYPFGVVDTSKFFLMF